MLSSCAISLFLVVVLTSLASCQFVVKNKWDSGFEAQMKVPVPTAKNGWTARLIFNHPTSKLDVRHLLIPAVQPKAIWTAQVVSSNADKSVWTIKNVDWNGNLGAGTTLDLSFVIHYPSGANSDEPRFEFADGSSPPVDNKPKDKPNNNDNNNPGKDKPVPNVPGAKYNLGEAIRLSNLFYEAQRSGRQAPDKKVDWRFDSSVNDRGDNGEDLSGGWHDAGDHVKFGFPMASSATMLLSGLIFFKEGYEAAGQYDNTLRTVRWPLEYFIKCHASDTLFYGQVGNGDADHAWWGRPEDMTMHRPAYSCGNGNGGADLIAETASAMAAGYYVFKDKDAGFASNLLGRAKRLYNMALKNQGPYIRCIPDAQSFYGSTEWRDEVGLAAAMLAFVTGENGDGHYTSEARKYLSQVSGTPWAMDWADKRAHARLIMYHMTKDQQFKTETETLMRDWLPGGSIPHTPKGLAWRLEWGSLRHASNAAFIALLAAKEGIRTKDYVNFARSQIYYILGDNGRSYLVGFGHNYPQKPHHKAASCQWKNVKASCDWNDYNSHAPNPHVLKGALVGGPRKDDSYEDVRNNFETNEVATDYNAGFTGALAGLKYYEAQTGPIGK